MIKGSLVALVTPFLEDGSVNFDKLGELIEYHISNKTDGIVVLGTTGEASTISFEEQIEVVKYSVKKVNKRVHLMVGAGSNDTLKSCHLAETFSKLGADSLLVITPYYNKTNTSGLIKHFEAIAQASTCGIVVYNVPGRTGMNIPVDVVEKLSKNEKILGIKEASGDMSYAMKISKYLSDDFVMLSGNDDLIVPMMSIGGSGVISVLANICPVDVHNICQLCLDSNYKEAQKLALRTLNLGHSLFYETNPIPIKEAMNYLGFNVGGLHLPLDNMSADKYNLMVKEIEAAKEAINL